MINVFLLERFLYINELIPVDVSVSDKELYCQYVAAGHLSNTLSDLSSVFERKIT